MPDRYRRHRRLCSRSGGTWRKQGQRKIQCTISADKQLRVGDVVAGRGFRKQFFNIVKSRVLPQISLLLFLWSLMCRDSINVREDIEFCLIQRNVASS